MSDFPQLKTGAVLQYPAQRQILYGTSIARFLDGSEQRFPLLASPLHSWAIQLDLLDESELQRLREFFRSQAGSTGTFAFTDPWDGTNYPHCSISDLELIETLAGESKAKTSLIVQESRT